MKRIREEGKIIKPKIGTEWHETRTELKVGEKWISYKIQRCPTYNSKDKELEPIPTDQNGITLR